ncbi:unnamed protein product [Bemisia tabaci]|uniref:Uncharacterized protein n=1 Tax=Bemisia tabaci TaxID=7038 RepID=A0A9P0A251_BEMTA|nr:unnamed protein product [Bemisia tabaci]
MSGLIPACGAGKLSRELASGFNNTPLISGNGCGGANVVLKWLNWPWPFSLCPDFVQVAIELLDYCLKAADPGKYQSLIQSSHFNLPNDFGVLRINSDIQQGVYRSGKSGNSTISAQGPEFSSFFGHFCLSLSEKFKCFKFSNCVKWRY